MSRSKVSALEALNAELKDQLAYAVSLRGRTGDVARELDLKLKEHVRHEDETVTPLLAAFEDLAAGQWPSDAMALGERFRAAERSYPRLISEHGDILAVAGRLREVAGAESEEEVVAMCDKLQCFAKVEEKVLYPAAVIAGRYLRMWERERERPQFAGD